MWCLSFAIATDTPKRTGVKPGSWCITLSLLEHSPPTWIDSRLLIEEPRRPPSPKKLLDDLPSPLSIFGQNAKLKPKPTISLRLKTGNAQLIAPSESTSSFMSQCDPQNEISVSLDDSMMGAGLQYEWVEKVLPACHVTNDDLAFTAEVPT
jgi:hypothetical protein